MVSSVQKGKAAEHVFIAKCLMRGMKCFAPICEDGRVDLIVNNKKVQVKVIGGTYNGRMNTRKVKCNSKSNVKIYSYSETDVDFFAGVHLETMRVAIVPISIVMTYASSMSLQCLMTEAYLERFDLIGV